MTRTAGSPPPTPRDTAPQPCYDARGLTRMYDHLTEVSTAMNALGWANYANDHEDGNGQFEQNFTFADALTTADRVVTARYLISVLAERRGMTATFMPKPFTDRTGSGLHLHLSLWRGGEPLFPERRRPARPGPEQDGLLVPRRHPRARLRAVRGDRPDRQLLQADGRRGAALGRHLVAAAGQLRRQRPHASRPRPGR